MAYNNKDYNWLHLSAQNTQVFIGKGILHNVVVNQTTGTVFGIYDGVASSSVIVGKIKASVLEGTYEYDASIANGLWIECGGGDYTVLYTQG